MAVAAPFFFGCDPRAEAKRAAAPHAREAESALAAKNFARAAIAAEAAVGYDPADPALRNLSLRVRLTTLAFSPGQVRLERPLELDYYAEDAIAREPNNAAVYLTARGYLALSLGDAAAAEARFREAITRQDSLAAPHVALGNLLAQGPTPEQAVGEFEKALALDDTLVAAKAGLGRILVAKDPARAIALMKDGLKGADSAGLRVSLAEALLAQGSVGDAIEHLSRATALDPKNAKSFVQLGDAFFTNGKSAQALTAFEAAAKLQSEPWSAYALGHLFLSSNAADRAAASFEAALQAGIPPVPALFYAGDARERLRDTPKALAHYTAYIRAAAPLQSEANRVTLVQERMQRLLTPAPK